VSWVRHRDIHLLTVGRYTYTSDQRFQSIHSPQTEDWMLQIRYPQRRDSGFYECQVSTTPPVGYSMYLSVVELLIKSTTSTMMAAGVDGILGPAVSLLNMFVTDADFDKGWTFSMGFSRK
ncbi:zwei Ig domain protein zig-8-like, partial [Zootermopsis nevadensis]|uniref:zwei Ig domain protein zig-8-like n=1 Tax=Zootermopsis nevadensis TaxID=136037 RepID=UPI000B8E3890